MAHPLPNLAATVVVATLLSATALVHAQSCPEPASSDFRVVTLVGPGDLNESSGSNGPVHIAVAPDRRVFVARMMTGTIVVFDPSDSTVTTSATIPTHFQTEDGLLGIALPPDFTTTNWIYAFYTDPNTQAPHRAHELARFTVVDNQLTNKKVILRIPRSVGEFSHAAGGLMFDSTGVLIIGTGDNVNPHDGNNSGYGPIWYPNPNADAQKSSSNTNDLRGKVLRIKPLPFPDDQTPAPGIGSTYSVPAGNLRDKISDPAFNPNWNPTQDSLAGVRPEVYALGVRNPYRPRVDSRTGWIFWGDVGPDANNNSSTQGTRGYDEWNLAIAPGFFGHPYCNGKNRPWNQLVSTSPRTYGPEYNCAATENVSPNNTGIRNMPPAVPAVFAYAVGDNAGTGTGPGDSRFGSGGSAAISGPMYRYDPNLQSAVKFPPYYEGKILFFDWVRRVMRWLDINPDGTLDATSAAVRNFTPTGLPQGSYIDAQFGPEGALYLLKFSQNGYSLGNGAALLRVEYTGSQDASCYQPFVATVGPGPSSLVPTPMRRALPPAIHNGVLTLPPGYRAATLHDLTGRRVWSYRRTDATRAESVPIPARYSTMLLHARLVP